MDFQNLNHVFYEGLDDGLALLRQISAANLSMHGWY